jgi:hypothetical protein
MQAAEEMQAEKVKEGKQADEEARRETEQAETARTLVSNVLPSTWASTPACGRALEGASLTRTT